MDITLFGPDYLEILILYALCLIADCCCAKQALFPHQQMRLLSLEILAVPSLFQFVGFREFVKSWEEQIYHLILLLFDIRIGFLRNRLFKLSSTNLCACLNLDVS